MRFHTSLAVTDIDKTAAFYEALFETAPAKTRPDYVKFLPEHLALNISFQQMDVPADQPARVHLGLEMPDQASLDRAFDRLTKLGFVSDTRESSVCCYAGQDKFHVTDPTGYQWEIYLLLEDTDHKIDANTTCCGPTLEATDKPTATASSSCC